jgi:hypothetical protein
MKKIRFIYCLTALICICFSACDFENPVIKKWWEEADQEFTKGIPVIITHPRSAVYTVGATANAMTVTASVNDGSALSYQWYFNDVNKNTDGHLIPGATGTNYVPPTDHESITYYYAVVTNMIDNNGSGKIAATVISRTAEIEVDAYGSGIVITIPGAGTGSNGLSAQDKVYDGTTVATVTGTITLNGVLPGDDVTIIKGTVVFMDANAGGNKPVFFINWSLGGADAAKYTLKMPNLTANITKADPVVIWPTGIIATLGRKLSDISLNGFGSGGPSGAFTWTSPNDSVGAAGARSHNVTFTPADTTNYNSLKKNVTIIVKDVIPLTIPGGSGSGGLSVLDKVYDGTTAATLTGTPVLNGIEAGDDVVLIQGTAAFVNANADKDKPIVFTGWSLGGADAGKYMLQMPSLTATITRATPVITWPTNLTAVFGQTLSEIAPHGNGTSNPAGRFAWLTPTDIVGNVGEKTHSMVFIPDDQLNYNLVILGVAITIENAAPVPIPGNGAGFRGIRPE